MDELISDIYLWTPTHRRASVGQLIRTYLPQFWEDTGCSLEKPIVSDGWQGRMERESQENPHYQPDLMRRRIYTKWQNRWNKNIHHKLSLIKPTLGDWRQAFRKSRKEWVIISQLCIGHTRFTHSLIFNEEQQPQCIMSNIPALLNTFL